MSRAKAGTAVAAAVLVVLLPVGGVVALAAVAAPAPAGAGCPGGQVSGQGAALIASAAKAAGFPADQQVTAVAIAIAESNGVTTAVNPSGASGLWQIMLPLHEALLGGGDWRDPAVNARAALLVWQLAGGSWTPWTTFTDGSYLAHVPEATSAVAGQAGTPAPSCTGGAPATGAAAVAISAAMSMVGTPYLWGGGEPGGFDCSGLTSWAFRAAGVVLPRTAAEQEAVSRPTSTPRPGDLVFFDVPAGHVGIYLGAGQMVDAPHTGAVVRVEAVWSGARYGAVLP